jgi:LPXTG-site transpeptidase (sortase) family protein
VTGWTLQLPGYGTGTLSLTESSGAGWLVFLNRVQDQPSPLKYPRPGASDFQVYLALFGGNHMRNRNKWIALLGVLLIVGGVGFILYTLGKNLPNPFDIASALGMDNNTLPVIAPSGSVGAPTVSLDASYAPANTPNPQAVGLIPDRLIIPVINLDAPIIPVSFSTITIGSQVYDQWLTPNQFAAGWQASSALLGLPGNTVLSGHHNEYGKVFKDLVKLKKGDIVSLYSIAREFRYQVVAAMILPELNQPLSVRLDNARWIEKSTDERITLITCWPAYSNTHRVIVVAYPIVNP